MGKEKHPFETKPLRDEQIVSITVYKKNEEYMRGFKIDYQSGEPSIIGSADGLSVGIINF